MTPDHLKSKKRGYDQHSNGQPAGNASSDQQAHKKYKYDDIASGNPDRRQFLQNGVPVHGTSWAGSPRNHHPNAQRSTNQHSQHTLKKSPSPLLRVPNLPPLPFINDPTLASIPFQHSSCHEQRSRLPNATTGAPQHQPQSYERLEFLGDAYIELIATHLVMSLFAPPIDVGKMSQARQSIVMNSSLAGFSRAYGFDERLRVHKSFYNRFDSNPRVKDKSWEKILGDVFEAYVAAVALSSPTREEGYKVIEAWLVALWTPLLEDAQRNGHPYSIVAPSIDNAPITPRGNNHTNNPLDPKIWPPIDPSAKEILVRDIVGKGCKIQYRAESPLDEITMKSSGQAINHMGCYFTGWGWQDAFLGEGRGYSKRDAELRAIGEALGGKLVGEIAERKRGFYEEKRRREEEEEKKRAEVGKEAVVEEISKGV